jgi:AraC-like DNA-binding protein
MAATIDHNIADVAHDALDVKFMLPDPRLAAYISGYHVYSAGAVQTVPYHEWFFPGWANVRFRLCSASWKLGFGSSEPTEVPAASIFGASRSGAHSIAYGGQFVGFGVTPVGWHRLFGASAHLFVDRLTPLDAVWPGSDALIEAIAAARDSADIKRLFDAVLLARLGPVHPDEALVARLMALLVSDHDVSIERAARDLGCSPVKLRRIALMHFGFPPKLLLRRSRFMKSFVAIYGKPPGDWSQTIDASYVDQSHFLRDANDFLGMTPSAYLALERPMTLMSMKVRTQQLGAPVQALHRIGKG